jgi:hypothetical protein
MALGKFCDRRKVLKLSACALAALCLGAKGAQAKSSQASVAYRASPNGRQRCANCTYFDEPDSCSVVIGRVSPRGWCNIWSG